MDPSLILIASAAIILGGGFIYGHFFSPYASAEKKLYNEPLKNASFVLDGELVKVGGKGKVLGSTVIAPLTGKKCIAYSAVVRMRGRRTSFYRIIKENVGDTIVVVDNGTYICINTMNRKLNMKNKFYSDSHPTEIQAKFLEKYNYNPRPLFGLMRPSYIFEEEIIEEDAEVSIVGKACWKQKEELNMMVPSDKILTIVPSDEIPVFITDK